jgi:hypothetical protein
MRRRSFNTSSESRAAECLTQACVAGRPSDPVADNQIVIGGEARRKLARPQERCELFHHDYVAQASLGLEGDALALTTHLGSNANEVVGEVDVGPRKRQRWPDGIPSSGS